MEYVTTYTSLSVCSSRYLFENVVVDCKEEDCVEEKKG